MSWSASNISALNLALTPAGLHSTSDQIKDCCLSQAVGAYEAGNRLGFDDKAAPIDGGQSTKTFGDCVYG